MIMRKKSDKLELLSEQLINQLGFKVKWLSDKSGSWLEKEYKKVAGRKICFCVELDHKNPIYIYGKSKSDSEYGFDEFLDLVLGSKKAISLDYFKKIDSKINRIIDIINEK